MADSAQDRQLPASERKILRAREEGQVARSRDLGHLFAMAASLGGLAWVGMEGLHPLLDWLRAGLSLGANAVSHPDHMLQHLARVATSGLSWCAAFMGLVLVAGVLAGLACGGWNFTWTPLAPQWQKLDPIAGLGRIFGGQQLGTALKASGLALVVLVVGAAYLGQHLHQFVLVPYAPLPLALRRALELLGTGLLWMLLPLAVFAAVDVPLQQWLLRRRLRMSHEEMKKEHKDVEGNVNVKSKIRLRMREMANRRMIAAVPRADLVVMNPTHYAVALKYDESRMAAPQVVAKGVDLMAMRIRDVAREAGVAVLEAPALARALYAHSEVDEEIPVALFSAVAQVLAWVFRLRAGEPPQPDVPAGMDPGVAA